MRYTGLSLVCHCACGRSILAHLCTYLQVKHISQVQSTHARGSLRLLVCVTGIYEIQGMFIQVYAGDNATMPRHKLPIKGLMVFCRCSECQNILKLLNICQGAACRYNIQSALVLGMPHHMWQINHCTLCCVPACGTSAKIQDTKTVRYSLLVCHCADGKAPVAQQC